MRTCSREMMREMKRELTKEIKREMKMEMKREMKMEMMRDMIREKSILIGCWLDYRTEQLKNVDIYDCSKIPSHVDDGTHIYSKGKNTSQLEQSMLYFTMQLIIAVFYISFD